MTHPTDCPCSWPADHVEDTQEWWAGPDGLWLLLHPVVAVSPPRWCAEVVRLLDGTAPWDGLTVGVQRTVRATRAEARERGCEMLREVAP